MEEDKRLPQSQNCQRRTRNCNGKFANTTTTTTNSTNEKRGKSKSHFGGLNENPLLSNNNNKNNSHFTAAPLTNSSKNLFNRNSLRRVPLILNALIFLIFTSGLNFGNCSVNSGGDSFINQPHTSVEDPTTTTSSTKIVNALNNKPKLLNDTHNLLLPKSAESQIR